MAALASSTAESANAARTAAWRAIDAVEVGVEFAACYATLEYNWRDFKPQSTAPSPTSTSTRNAHYSAAAATPAHHGIGPSSSLVASQVAADDPYAIDTSQPTASPHINPHSRTSKSSTTAVLKAVPITSPLFEAAAAAVISCVPAKGLTASVQRAYSQLSTEMHEAMAILDRAEPLALHLARLATGLDFAPDVRGNGLWALLHAVKACIAEIRLHSEHCAAIKQNLLFDAAAEAVTLASWSQRLLAGSLFPIITLAIQIVEDVACQDAVDAGGGLFSSPDAYDAALVQLHQVDCTPFYGKCLGFQFAPSLRKILTGVATAMAAFFTAYEGSFEGGVAKTVSNAFSAGLCLINVNSRTKGLSKAHGGFDGCDPTLLQAFWSLTETAVVSAISSSVLSAPIAVHMEIVVPVSTLAVDGTVLRAGELTALVPKKSRSSMNLGGTGSNSSAAGAAAGYRQTFEPQRVSVTPARLPTPAAAAAAASAAATRDSRRGSGNTGGGVDGDGGNDTEFEGSGWTVVEHGPAPDTVVCRTHGDRVAGVDADEEVDLAAVRTERSNLERRILGTAGLLREDSEESMFPAMPESVMDTVRSVYECFACDPAATSGSKKRSVDGFESTDYDHISESEMKDLPHFDQVKVTLFSKKARQGMVPTAAAAAAANDRPTTTDAGGGGSSGGGGNVGSASMFGDDGCISSSGDGRTSFSSSSPSASSGPASKPLSKGLVLHFHGGGFVSSTSKTHEVYLRKWAVELDCPVVSIDYSLSPQHPYPRALNECFFVYSWTLANAHRFGWSGERICFTGDSAGGNLAVAVALRCIQDGIRGPDGIVIAYPVLCVASQMSPSRLLSLLDPVLPYGVLIGCLRAYMPAAKHRDRSQLPSAGELDAAAAEIGEGGKGSGFGASRGTSGEVDPLLSPLGADPSLLRKLPPISIAGVLLDPLLDDAVAFAKRLKRLGNTVRLQVFENLCHGFLMFSAVHRESEEAAGVCSKWIKEAIDADAM